MPITDSFFRLKNCQKVKFREIKIYPERNSGRLKIFAMKTSGQKIFMQNQKLVGHGEKLHLSEKI